jgi:hypothetical protein
MKAVCPTCGTYGSIQIFLADKDARGFDVLIARLAPDIGPLVLEYLTLFSPAKRALTWPRARRLLEELIPMIETAQVQRHGRAWAAPRDAWRSAIQQMIDRRDRLQLPLANHGYLLEILAGSQNRAEAQLEARGEQQRQVASGRRGPSQAKTLGEISENPDVTPRGRAVAALAAEIGRRKKEGEPEMTPKEMREYQSKRLREFSGSDA